MIDPRYIWNVIYNARSNRCHPPTSPNTAPATQNDHPKSDRNLLKTAETSFTVRGRFLLLDSTIVYTHQKSYGDGTCLIVIVKKCVKQTGVSDDEQLEESHTIPGWSSTDCLKTLRRTITHCGLGSLASCCLRKSWQWYGLLWIVNLRRHWLNT